MNDITKIRTSGTIESYDPNGIHKDTLYTVVDTNDLYYNGNKITSEKLVDFKIADTLESSPAIVEAVTDLKNILNDDEDAAMAVEKQIVDAKVKVFDDMFLRAVGKWGTVDHTHMENGKPYPYYLNKIWMTYEEAIDVVNAGAPSTIYLEWRYSYSNIRTHLPFTNGLPATGTSTAKVRAICFAKNTSMEIINVNVLGTGLTFTPDNFKNLGATNASIFSGDNLKEIIGIIAASKAEEYTNCRIFGKCPSLEEVQVKGVTYNLTIKELPKISANSLTYLFKNRAGVSEITITLHADIYNKIINEEDDYAGLADLALEKNIILATA